MYLRGKRHDPITSISGLTDRFNPIKLGSIRLGIKKEKDGKTYPAEVDYFIVPPEVAIKFGDKPKALLISFIQNDQGQIFPQAYKRWGQHTGLVCVGNGQVGMEKVVEGGYKEVKCPCKEYEKKRCNIQATLKFYVPDVDTRGVYHITTSSIMSIVNINSGITLAKQLLFKIRGSDDITGMPFILERKEAKTHHKMETQTHYPMVLALDIKRCAAGNAARLLYDRAKIAELPPPDQVAAQAESTLPPFEDTPSPGPVDETEVFIQESEREAAEAAKEMSNDEQDAPQPTPQHAGEDEQGVSTHDTSIPDIGAQKEKERKDKQAEADRYKDLVRQCSALARATKKTGELSKAMDRAGACDMYDFAAKSKILNEFLKEIGSKNDVEQGDQGQHSEEQQSREM